ncbi:MAG: hypothetical protein ACQESJ_02695 [Bacteroidota bacterium]
MYYNSENQSVALANSDFANLTKITKQLIHKVDMPQLGLYSTMSHDALWLSLILQFCVISGKRMTEDLRADEKKLYEFSKKLNFRYLISMRNNRKKYISEILKEYKATSFYNKQAGRIEDLLDSPAVINQNKIVLLNGIDHNRQNYSEIRDILMSRVPHFKLKSASGFMVENGLSLDVIAINTRIGEVLNQHFDLNLENRKIQSSRKIYVAVENALRKACGQIGVPLAYFSRMLFQYSDKDTISFILEDV